MNSDLHPVSAKEKKLENVLNFFLIVFLRTSQHDQLQFRCSSKNEIEGPIIYLEKK